jgi:hypothetical protein
VYLHWYILKKKGKKEKHKREIDMWADKQAGKQAWE